MSIRRPLLVLAAVIMPVTGLLAQASHPLVGRWNIEFQRGQRMENGTVTPIMGTGDLVVEARGDSLVATLTTAGTRPDGSTVPPAVMRGAARGSEAVFNHTTTAQLNMNGEVRNADAITTWTFRVAGDLLEGTMRREITGLMLQVPMEPSPVKGKRVS
jgi:hypothetical protein